MLRGFEQRHLILIESDWLVLAGINNRFVKVYSLIAILLIATTLISSPPKKNVQEVFWPPAPNILK